MRYMMIVKGNEQFDRAAAPPTALMEAIGTLIEESAKAGKIVSFGGLRETTGAARVRIAKGKLTMTDGPFTESKEVIGGFTIMNLESREEAIAEAVKFMELHRVHWPEWEGETEIRLMYDEGEGPA